MLFRKKINIDQMKENILLLEKQRSDLLPKIDFLEQKEVDLIQRGASSQSCIEKKQIARHVIVTRRELGRHKAQADMLTKQIDILGTHIHHLTLTERGKRMELPKAEELTREAAQAEHMIAELNANAALVSSMEIGGSSVSNEEAAVLEEFAAAAKKDIPQSLKSLREEINIMSQDCKTEESEQKPIGVAEK